MVQEYLLDHGFSLQDKHPSHMHSYLGAGFQLARNACFWTVGRNWNTREKPTWAWQEHANSKKKGPILNETQKVMNTAPPCCPYMKFFLSDHFRANSNVIADTSGASVMFTLWWQSGPQMWALSHSAICNAQTRSCIFPSLWKINFLIHIHRAFLLHLYTLVEFHTLTRESFRWEEWVGSMCGRGLCHMHRP